MPSRARRETHCAIYTRKSSEAGLEQDFNSLDAQRESCAAYIKSQRHEGWTALPTRYDDGGLSGATMARPALTRLLADIEAGRIDTVVVYKVDRLTRSLGDFARIVEVFDKQGVSFVSVTQQFNTINSMGRLTLNMLLTFAQFEREVTGERIRDKIAASKQKGLWMGGLAATWCSRPRAQPAGGSDRRPSWRADDPQPCQQAGPPLSLLRQSVLTQAGSLKSCRHGAARTGSGTGTTGGAANHGVPPGRRRVA